MNSNAKTYMLIVLSLSLLFYSLAWADENDLAWSTFLGGGNADYAYDIVLDDSCYVHITGRTISSNFPTTIGAFDIGYDGGPGDVFITKIDPLGTSLMFSTYLGEDYNEEGRSITLDKSGYIYVTGKTWSNRFPVTPAAFDTTYNNNGDGFLTKLNPDGSDLIYSTFIGGSSDDYVFSVTVDELYCVYITGATSSTNFPYTTGSFDTTFCGADHCDAFVAKFNPSGSALEYSTFLGGNWDDPAYSIAVDDSGCAYVVGTTGSENFPTTLGAFDTSYNGSSGYDYDAYVAKFNQTGTVLEYSTFLGGSTGTGTSWASEAARAVAIDDSGNIYVAGGTYSEDFPVTTGAFDEAHNGSRDVFITKLNPSASTLIYSTFLGGSNNDESYDIVVYDHGDLYLIGRTSSADFPTTQTAFDTTQNGSEDIFISRLNQAGDILQYSTFLGGDGAEYEFPSIAVDSVGNAHVSGTTASSDFPTTSGAYDTSYNGGAYDVFVSKLIIDLIPPEAIADLTVQLDSGSKSYGGNLYFSWSEPHDDIGISHYVIYRSTSHYILGDSLASTSDTFYLDTYVYAIGHPYLHYFYTIKAVDYGENKSEASNQVGEFDKVLRW